jgi:hypothetical protein
MSLKRPIRNSAVASSFVLAHSAFAGIPAEVVQACSSGDSTNCNDSIKALAPCTKIECTNEQFALMQMAEANARAKQVCAINQDSNECEIAGKRAIELTDAIKKAEGEHWVSPALGGALIGDEPVVTVTGSTFFTTEDYHAGDCTTLKGAQLELTVNDKNDGYNVHYTAQMKTKFSVMGDVWHISWQYIDAAGKPVLSTNTYDLPPGSRMHPQFGIYDVDFRFTIPDSPALIQQHLKSIKTVVPRSSC